MNENVTNSFLHYESYTRVTWNQNATNFAQELYPTLNDWNHHLTNNVTPSFGQNTERTPSIPATEMTKPSTSTFDMNRHSNRHNLDGAPGIKLYFLCFEILKRLFISYGSFRNKLSKRSYMKCFTCLLLLSQYLIYEYFF